LSKDEIEKLEPKCTVAESKGLVMSESQAMNTDNS
jgi:hypothetical protein